MIKRLSKCIGEYKLPSLLAPFFISLEVLMEVIIPTYMGKLLDNGINGRDGQGDMAYIFKTGAFLAVLCVFSLLFGMLSGKYAAKASCGFAKNLRREMFYNLQSFSFSNIDSSVKYLS